MAEGDVPLVSSFGGSEIEFGANGAKVTKNSSSRMSTLLFWQGKGKSNGAPNGRNWIHTPDALIKGHVAYLVKFLGCTQVDQPKGIDVVKEAIKKLQFAQQLKKSEAKDGAKCKKVEITISVDGVAIQEPRTNNITYQFPLHRISYCADDKGAKKYFSFIAKQAVDGEDRHQCFVFFSTKLASEITLTIGQAFELAYRRFMTDNGKYIEMQKLSLQNRILELQMMAYKNRLQELSKITYKEDLSAYLSRQGLADITEFRPPPPLENQLAAIALANGFAPAPEPATNGNGQEAGSQHAADADDLLLATPPPQHNGKHFSGKSFDLSNKNPVVGTKLEGLLLNSDSDSDFDPRAFESEPFPAPRHAAPAAPAPRPAAPEHAPPAPAPAPAPAAHTTPPPLLAPPPKASKRQNTPQQPSPQQQQQQHATPQPLTNGSDLFGSAPFAAPYASPFAPKASQPNYDISDFNLQTSVFNSTSFTNGLSGYEVEQRGIFGGGYSPAFNGFGDLSDKQPVGLDSGFDGFLDKTISEMKDGFSRGITFGNDDFSIDNFDPLKKN